jgi:hypothetical protein
MGSRVAPTSSIPGGAIVTNSKDHLPPPSTVTPAATVTPSEKVTEDDISSQDAAAITAEDDHKQVRFDKEGGGDVESTTSSVSGDSPSKRGLVSRRGRGSPGRALMASSGSTTSSPSNEPHVRDNTSVLEFKTFRSPERNKQRDENDTVPSLCSTESGDRKEDEIEKNRGSHKDITNCYNNSNRKDENSLLVSTKALGLSHANSSTSVSSTSCKKTSVTFSPVPPNNSSDKHPKTPIRSPPGGRVGSLPNLYDAPIGSPGAIFLSPTTPMSKARIMGDSIVGRTPLTPRTPKDRFLTTPTDFASDYGKYPMSGSLLDSSNVLSWLHSPSANGLFSPGGGLGSMMNTPKGAAPRTPHTPTVTSTSFFFSDVAGLPRGSESTSSSSSPPNKKEKRSGNSMICISPLSSQKAGKNGVPSSLSPKFNMEMFASPAERSGMAKLGMKMRGVSRSGGGLDAVHLADSDFAEDEDLARLLQLANNTPRPSVPPATVSSSDSTNHIPPTSNSQQQEANDNLPVLSLQSIGPGDANGNGAKLTRKTQARDLGDGAESLRPATADTHTVTPATVVSSSDVNTKKHSGSVHNIMNPFVTPYHQHEAVYNPALYPGLSHGGSMRVVVGGPPRTKVGTSPGTIRYTVGRPGEFPAQYPPTSHYPPPGVPPHMHHQFARYPPPSHHGTTTRHTPLYTAECQPSAKKQPVKATPKRPSPVPEPKQATPPKKAKKQTPPSGHKKKNRSPQLVDKADRQKAAATIQAVNQASGGKNDKAAALAAAILRGVTMRPSGKWQAQLYFAGKSRYIGVFDTREKAALAYEIARERLKAEKNADGGALSPKQTEAAVNAARKAAFDGVNERGV